jgi:hypothetical protein
VFNRRRLPFAVAGACLVLASGAAADTTANSFTAASTPSYVKPSTSATYTLTLTNSSSSEEGADRAKIAVATDFAVDEASVQASAGAAGECVASTWVADGVLLSSGKINLRRPGGAGNSRLCPGATLTVVFTATSAASEGSYSWEPELLGDEEAFTVSGAAPSVEVDGTPPTLTIGQKPADPSNSRSASFTFTASEPATLCKLDDAEFASCTSPAGYNDLTDGEHTFAVQATDEAGNTGQESYAWTVDATAPAVAITAKPSNLSNSRSASFAFTASEPATECKLDAAAFAPCTSPADYSDLADGEHRFAVQATDAAGNTGEATYIWTIETRPPTAAVASGPAALSNSRSATFAFTADEPSSFECRVDDRSFEPCTSPATYQGLGDGAHTFAVRPTDAIGNTGASSSYSWTIDATAPETTLGAAPRSRTRAVSATFMFSANELASFECKLDGAAFAPCTSPQSYARLRKSGHSFEVRAIDPAGNVDPTPAAHRWTIAAAPRRAKTSSALLAPRARARVTSPPLLVWRRVARASYYNVQLYRGSVKVLSSWPTRPRLQLRARWWYLRRTRKLFPGVYRWYVWPGYGPASANRYGRLLGQSTFTVASG